MVLQNSGVPLNGLGQGLYIAVSTLSLSLNWIKFNYWDIYHQYGTVCISQDPFPFCYEIEQGLAVGFLFPSAFAGLLSLLTAVVPRHSQNEMQKGSKAFQTSGSNVKQSTSMDQAICLGKTVWQVARFWLEIVALVFPKKLSRFW